MPGPANTTSSLQDDCATRGSRQNALFLAVAPLQSIRRRRAYRPSRRRHPDFRTATVRGFCASGSPRLRIARYRFNLCLGLRLTHGGPFWLCLGRPHRIEICAVGGSRRMCRRRWRRSPARHWLAFFGRACSHGGRRQRRGRPNAERSLAGGLTADAAGRGGDSEISSSSASGMSGLRSVGADFLEIVSSNGLLGPGTGSSAADAGLTGNEAGPEPAPGVRCNRIFQRLGRWRGPARIAAWPSSRRPAAAARRPRLAQ